MDTLLLTYGLSILLSTMSSFLPTGVTLFFNALTAILPYSTLLCSILPKKEILTNNTPITITYTVGKTNFLSLFVFINSPS